MKQPIDAVDIVVETPDPKSLDAIVQSFGAAVVQDNIQTGHYLRKDGGYVVRCFGNVGFIEFAIKNQGYGQLIKRLPGLV